MILGLCRGHIGYVGLHTDFLGLYGFYRDCKGDRSRLGPPYLGAIFVGVSALNSKRIEIL